jgi:ABC-type transport system involved in multi-copper enzyme maturation permease subunit
MLRAELASLFSRPVALGALVIAVIVGALTLLFLVWAGNQGGMQLNGQSAASMVDQTPAGALGYALRVRNFFVLPILLVLATAGMISTELSDNTLRETLVRPVPRWSVLLARLSALNALAAATLALTWIVAFVGGVALYGSPGDIGQVTLGYLASWASDLGLICVAMAVSVFLRSAGGVVVAVILGLMLDLALRTGARAVGMISQMVRQSAGAPEEEPLLLGNALACWEGWKDGFAPEPFAGLAFLIAVCLAITFWRFERLQVS